MSYLSTRLPPTEKPDQLSMWIDEAIWGHRFYDEQTPWFVFLEFLNIFVHEVSKGRAFNEAEGFNTLKYRPERRLELRNILFNNPQLYVIRNLPLADNHKWTQWLATMKQGQGLADPKFDYLVPRFNSFDDFAALVSIIQTTSIEVDSNKRWTSKFAFPYGPACLYEDLNKDATTNDRRFFGRTGELLYLMLSRSEEKENLRDALLPLANGELSQWNAIVSCLQPTEKSQSGSELTRSYLPYPQHLAYNYIAEDWLAVLELEMPGFDPIPYLVNLLGLHLVKYQLTVARDVAGIVSPYRMVCEIVAPKKTIVRELSSETYQSNNLLSAQALDSYLSAIESSPEWNQAKIQPSPFAHCRQVLKKMVQWGEDYDGTSDPDSLFNELKQAAKRRHQQHVANVHRNYGRAIGLVSKRGTNRLRYAPSDDLLKTIIFANVKRRMEFSLFLSRIYERYGLIIGDREAALVLDNNEYDIKAFQANARRLEQRLASLGLLKRLSDGCAYVLNPYSRSNP
jgi:hypothetical protein